jgi:hypothetical protein
MPKPTELSGGPARARYAPRGRLTVIDMLRPVEKQTLNNLM